MNKFEQIDKSRKLLGLQESATRDEIKKNYKALLHRWHPDKCKEDQDKCKEMTDNIIKAYHIIMDYCENYKYSFSKENVKNYYNSRDWWFDQFGNDPLWG
jgi:DnaJ-class molecular chaperone